MSGAASQASSRLAWLAPLLISILGASILGSYSQGTTDNVLYSKGKELYDTYIQRPFLGRIQAPLQTHCYDSIKTLDAENPHARCFTVSGHRFDRILPDLEANEIIGHRESYENDTNVHFHEGHVIPGLWDGHGHLLQYGEFLHSVNIFGAKTPSELRERVREYLRTNPESGDKDNWIRGVGWDQNILGHMPTAEDLADPVLEGLYVMIDRVDVHCTLVSKAILDLLPDEFPDIPGGEVVREPGMGVFCDNAMDMVYDLWPQPNEARKTEFVKSAMKDLNRFGIVGVHDAGVNSAGLDLFKKLTKTPDWTVRVYAMAECTAGHNHFCADEVSKVSFQETGDLLAVQSIKLFADGALGSWGSAMIEPYSDRPDASGSLLASASALTDISKSWAKAGYQVSIHAIGDLANRVAIDALEEALKVACPDQPTAECQKTRRFRIEHAQVIHPDDQQRMHSIGIIPSIQPTHATSDMAYAEKRLGRKRTAESAYRMRSVLGLNPVLGSDFPVEPPDPFRGIYAATTRKSPNTGKNADGGEGKGWHDGEALTLEEALLGFTRAPAAAAVGGGLEAGVIKGGGLADWVVLDRSLGEYDAEDLRSMRVEETWVGGRAAYRRGGL
ncbi:putative amidohydrolase [Zalerion maritima]|uniref:Amidohydrolase n=1 Tax=Zalerion maritima TaxID=339359 RepID=A0AAD5RMC1_9PEZI|nr:putative amidohydrolase [Zalerion maritima]